VRGQMLVEPLNALNAVRSVDEMRDLDLEDARVLTSTLLAPSPRPPKIALDLGLVEPVPSNDERAGPGSQLHLTAGAPWNLGRLRCPDDDVTGFETASVFRLDKRGSR
jgi:hypothetical protein